MEVKVVQNILKANDSVARSNRARFDAAGLLAVNLIGSPGSGKTRLLERTIPLLAGRYGLGCIEGDPYTTRGGCHLEAAMVATAFDELDTDVDFLFIENVGNLMCPSQYDLGEYHTVVVLSVAEGADKPEKYPAAFQRASAVVINKLDLLPFTDVDLATVTGEGVEPWQRWLEEKLAERLAR